MRIALLFVLASCALAGCQRSLDRHDVQQFIDQADQAARNRFAPEICALRGKNFQMRLKLHEHDARREPDVLEMDRRLYCREAGRFSRLRQYLLERKSMSIDVAADRKTATVTSEYVETLPYYPDGAMPRTPDDFWDFQMVESRDVSVVGIEDGDLVFLSSDVESTQSLIPKSSVDIPYQ